MKTLYKFLEEFAGPDGATPGNTTGMGNPMIPDGDSLGSGDIFTAKSRKQKKKKKHEVSIKNI